MLIIHKVEHWPSTIINFGLLMRCEQVSNVVFGEHRAAKHSHNFSDISIKLEVMLDDCYKAVCRDNSIYLDVDSIQTVPPKSLDSKVLLYELEEKFYSPPILVQECNVFGRKIEIVSVVRECSLELGGIVDDAPDDRRIVFFVTLSGEPYGLISENTVITIEQVIALYNLILWFAFLSNDKERIQALYSEKPRQIPIATVEDIASQRLVLYPVHGVDIIHSCLCNGKHHRDCRHYINLSMYFDTCHVAFVFSPIKYSQTEAYSGGIERIVLTKKFEWLTFTLPLGYIHHVIGHLLEDVIISLVIGVRKSCPFNCLTTESKVIGFVCMGVGNICKFSKTATTVKLTKHENQELIPMCQTPTFGLVITLGDKSLKISLREEIYHLTENISAAIHLYAHSYTSYKGNQFKCATRFFG